MWKRCARAGWLLGTALLLSACIKQVREDNIIIPRSAPAVTAATVVAAPWQVAPLQVVRDDGAILRGAHFKRPGSRATVLYFGGNGLTLSKNVQFLLDIYRELPVDVVAFDHRGYGGSTGTPTFPLLYADGLAIYDQLTAGSALPRPLIVHGHSLGSFVAGQVAAQRTLDGVVLESSATTAEDWVAGFRSGIPWYLRPVVHVRLAPALRGQGNAAVMPGLTEPLLVVVGERDDTTPPAMSRRLFALSTLPEQRKELLIVPGADHMRASGSSEFRAAMLRLLDRASLH